MYYEWIYSPCVAFQNPVYIVQISRREKKRVLHIECRVAGLPTLDCLSRKKVWRAVRVVELPDLAWAIHILGAFEDPWDCLGSPFVCHTAIDSEGPLIICVAKVDDSRASWISTLNPVTVLITSRWVASTC